LQSELNFKLKSYTITILPSIFLY